MRLWPCPFSHAMADSLHCLDGTGPASAARSNGPLRTTLAVYVRQIFGGCRKALGPKTLGGIRKCEDELGDKQRVGSERIAKGTAKHRQCNEYRRKTGLHLGGLAASDCEQRSWRSLGWDLAVALLALQALSAPSVGFVGQLRTTPPCLPSAHSPRDGPRGWGGGPSRWFLRGRKGLRQRTEKRKNFGASSFPK